MNCKPNDHAIVTRRLAGVYRLIAARDPHALSMLDKLIGHPVGKLTELVESPVGPAWLLEHHVRSPEGCMCAFRALPDAILTPLKPPSDEEDIFSQQPIDSDVRAASRVLP